jgi:hypothetical protein
MLSSRLFLPTPIIILQRSSNDSNPLVLSFYLWDSHKSSRAFRTLSIIPSRHRTQSEFLINLATFGLRKHCPLSRARLHFLGSLVMWSQPEYMTSVILHMVWNICVEPRSESGLWMGIALCGVWSDDKNKCLRFWDLVKSAIFMKNMVSVRRDEKGLIYRVKAKSGLAKFV